MFARDMAVIGCDYFVQVEGGFCHSRPAAVSEAHSWSGKRARYETRSDEMVDHEVVRGVVASSVGEYVSVCEREVDCQVKAGEPKEKRSQGQVSGSISLTLHDS